METNYQNKMAPLQDASKKLNYKSADYNVAINRKSKAFIMNRKDVEAMLSAERFKSMKEAEQAGWRFLP